MTVDDEAAVARARRPRQWWIASVLVAVGCTAAALVLVFRGDDGARRAAEAVADAMSDGDEEAYEAVVCAVEDPFFGPVSPMPEVDGESSVVGVSGSEKDDGTNIAQATIDTTWKRDYYELFLTESDDGWCLEAIASCRTGSYENDSYRLPCPHRPEE
ncbi:hypothetical protein [Streptomyces sp. 6N223]|uniref:hypothetical protein n=1 Tax=Streptomyces sp. 6N223 TaxID=3457412 RepID=UPI003FD217E6